MKSTSLLLVAVLNLPIMALAQQGLFPSETENTPIARMSSAYAAGNFKQMLTEAKNTLMEQSNDPLVQDNVLSLVKKAYELQGQNGIDADWHLPPEIVQMKVSAVRSQSDVPEYYLKIYGSFKEQGLIKQLQVIRYPNEIVLDKEAGVGGWEEGAALGDDKPEYSLQGKKSKTPVPSGLYLLKLELTNGKRMDDGWFLLSDDLNSSASPNIQTPAVGETFQTQNPTFKWVDFHSPEYKPGETRAVWLGVFQVEAPSYNWDEKLSFYKESPILQQITIGSGPGIYGVSKLDTGHYVFMVSYSERVRFGDILIGRVSATTRRFSISTTGQ